MNWTKDHPEIINFLNEKLKSQSYEVEGLAGDASSRKYYRVRLANEDSYVLMAWEPFKIDHFPFLNVHKHFKNHGVQVPEVLGFSSEFGLVLLEDLGDFTLETQFWTSQRPEEYIPFYEKAVDELIKIHFRATEDRASECMAFGYAFDVEKYLWELDYMQTHLIEGLLQIKLNDDQKENLKLIFTNIATRLHLQPKTIQHRDYHSRNIMIKDGLTRVIDFQDARMGPIQYDLVSLFKDSYVNFKTSLERKFVISYYEESKKYDKNLRSREEFFLIYELQVIQRCLKAAGSFASFYQLKQDSRYLKYLSGTLIKVKDALENFPEYKFLLKLMEDYKLFSIDYKEIPMHHQASVRSGVDSHPHDHANSNSNEINKMSLAHKKDGQL